MQTAESTLQSAQTRLDNLLNPRPEDVAAARSNVQSAEAALRAALLKQETDNYGGNAVQYLNAQSNYQSAQNTLAQAQENLDQTRAGASQSEIATAQTQVATAQVLLQAAVSTRDQNQQKGASADRLRIDQEAVTAAQDNLTAAQDKLKELQAQPSRARIVAAQRDGALLLPTRAVTVPARISGPTSPEEIRPAQVLVGTPGGIQPRAIQIGLTTEQMTEVVSVLREGEEVVLTLAPTTPPS